MYLCAGPKRDPGGGLSIGTPIGTACAIFISSVALQGSPTAFLPTRTRLMRSTQASSSALPFSIQLYPSHSLLATHHTFLSSRRRRAHRSYEGRRSIIHPPQPRLVSINTYRGLHILRQRITRAAVYARQRRRRRELPRSLLVPLARLNFSSATSTPCRAHPVPLWAAKVRCRLR